MLSRLSGSVLAIAAAIAADCLAHAKLDPEVAFQHQYIKNHGLAPENAEHFERNRHPDGHGEEIPFEWKDGKLRIEIPFKKLSNLTTVVDVTVAAGDENQARR